MCGCSGGGRRNISSSRSVSRQNIAPIRAAATPRVQAQTTKTNSLTANQRTTERLRRLALQKRMGR